MSEIGEEILIIKMYVGDFNNENIGHEIINFFKTDNGEEYIYIPAYGGMGKGHYKKINYIILTTGIENDRVKVLAMAEIDRDDEIINQIDLEKEHGDEKINQLQKEIIDEKDIRYGNQKLYDIMQYNKGDSKAIYISYKVKKILRVKKDIFICNHSYAEENNPKVLNNPEKYIILNDIVKTKIRQLPSQKMYAIISENAEKNNYESIKQLLENDNLEAEDTTEKVNIERYSKKNSVNFLHMCQKENEEQIYTNMLYYWFTRKINEHSMFELFVMDFMKQQGIKKIPIDDYSLSKESKSGSGRMDMLAQSSKNVIIIENKIKAKLHHVDKENKTTQLSKYIDDVHKGKYKNDDENEEKRNIYGIIFIPNYNLSQIENEIENLEENYEKIKKIYRIVTYDNLYEFFKKYENNISLKNDLFYKYYEDFLNALYSQHYNNINDKLREDREIKFVNAIKMLNK